MKIYLEILKICLILMDKKNHLSLSVVLILYLCLRFNSWMLLMELLVKLHINVKIFAMLVMEQNVKQVQNLADALHVMEKEV